ncbi:hypothetical protein ES703_38502 [subsurface metagenome]
MVKVLGTTKYIKVSEETHQALTAICRKDQSYDALITDLIRGRNDVPELVARIRTLERELQKKEAEG